MIDDLRYAWRSLRRTPGFTTATLLTLALGIGACTTIFSLVNATLLKPVPYPEPHRVAVLTATNGTSTFLSASHSGITFTLVRDRIRLIEAISAQSGITNWNLSMSGSAISVRGLRVSTDYLKAHGVRPLVGREFTVDEDTPHGADAAMLSERLTTRLFSDPSAALGKGVILGGRPHTVVGILPPDFVSIPGADVLTPLRTNDRDQGVNYRVIGLLRHGATVDAARAELESVRADILRTISNLVGSRVPHLSWTPYRDVLGQAVRLPLLVLLGAVGFLLVIACVNVANLYVARAVSRHREIATRASLGANRRHLIRHVLTESMMLAIAGSALGLLVAAASTQLLLSFISEDTARDLLAGGTIDLDWRVLLATIAITLASGLFFGLAPALTSSGVAPGMVLSVRSTGSPATAGLRRMLTVAEVALAVVLLVGAGLLIRSFMNLTSVDLGFAPEGVVVGRMSLQGPSATDAAARQRLIEQGLARMRQLPGVSAVAVSNSIPIEPTLNLPMTPPAGSLIGQMRAVDWRFVSPDYFSLFQIDTLAGMTFTDEHRPGRPAVAVVNEAFARTYFGDTNPIGRTITFGGDRPLEIIGVVADTKARSNAGFVRNLTFGALGAAHSPGVFVPAAQAPHGTVQAANRFFDTKWIVRSSRPAPAVEAGMRKIVQSLDSSLAFIRFDTMTSVVRRDLDLQRLLTMLLVAFATSAVLLAAIGLYGLIAYAAAQRRQEVGVRMALGASAWSVLRSFLGEGVMLAVVGLTLGLAGAIAVTRLLTSRLFGVTPLDPGTFVAAAIALVTIAACASLIPATSAARTDPVRALRGE